MRLFMIRATLAALAILACASCAPRMSLFGNGVDPLKEYVLLEGTGGKVAVVHINGFLSLSPHSSFLGQRPGVVQETLARLKMAAEDGDVGAVVLAVNSPGGTVTASDVLYREIMRFREQTGIKVVSCMMDVAASGGYYLSAAADRIVAHPTTVTGSIGTILIRPDISGLMDLVGVRAEVSKSGRLKDMGSPLRASTEEERELLQSIIDGHNARFLQVVSSHRKLTGDRLAAVATARVFLAPQAMEAGLVDEIGYLPEAIGVAEKLAGLPKNSEVVVYRRSRQPDDTMYNAVSASAPAAPVASVLPQGASSALTMPPAGFHYLWAPGYSGQ